MGSLSLTPSSFAASSTARSPISSARWPNASEPSYQWTRTILPFFVRQSNRVSR